MNVNLHHLQLFYYAAKAKGISQAVKIIPYGIQQPAVSQQLIQLEEETGISLFARKPFKLTPAGEALYRFAAKFFDNLESEISSIKDEAGIRIRFGCPSIISANYLPELISILLQNFPALRPHVTELEGGTSFTALINREIDAAVSFGPPPRSKSIIVKSLFTIPMALVLPQGHRFLKQGYWPKDDFAKEKWIAIQEQSGGTRDLLEGLSSFGISPEFVASTNSVQAAFRYIEMGLGIALMVQPTLDLLKQYKLAALPLPDIFGNSNLSLSWHTDLEIDMKIMNFILKTAKEIGKKYVKGT